MGMIIITPVLLAWLGRPIHRPPLRKMIEFGLLLVGVAGASRLIFGDIVRTQQASYVLGVALFPFIIWAAYHFQQRGSSTVVLTISTIAIWYTTRGYGPFATSDVNSSLMSLQAFLGLLSLTGLAMAAAISEQANAARVLRQSQQALEQRVIERTTQLAQTNQKLQSEINERILADAARQVAEQDYQDLFESAPDIIFRTDMEGNFVALNPATEAILGYQRDDLIGRNFLSILDPTAQAITTEMLQRKTKLLTDRTIYEIELQTVTGQQLVLEIVSHLKFRDHQPIGIFGIARDITHHKDTENALRDSEQRLIDLINFLPDPTLAIDLTGKIIIWNYI